MALPDLTGLTPAELQTVQQRAAELLGARHSLEQTNRAALLDEAQLENQIAALVAAAADLTTMIDGMVGRSDLKTVAQVLRRTVNNTVRLLRVVGNRLDSTVVGS